MTTDELRKKFLTFFESKSHKIYPSDTLVPSDDPTLLFTSAGMNQFKQEFMGKPTRYRRLATCQKCLRTADLDKVGKTNSHHTFFEMLGNFSFGDYFKKEAIGFAWEFVTKELNLPLEKLWVSVYQDDQEAYQIWRKQIGIAEGKIIKLGPEENFWPANAPEDGPDGPCGPCSEIFYDQGPTVGCGRPDCSPACNCSRFVETWNLVFTQFERKGKNNLLTLPNKNIDTGMGLERMAAVLQGVNNNFEIDSFKPIMAQIIKLAAPGQNLRAAYAIADHIRAVSFAIADGVMPSNDERGYVIRKLIRRAVWHGQSLGIKKAFLHKIVPSVCRVMKSAYPDLEAKREQIAQVVLAEERRFHHTLERAIGFAEETIARLKEQGQAKIPGEIAFKLYDTYGLPQEMLESIIQSRGFGWDRQGFQHELELQRELSRKGTAFSEAVFADTLVSRFKLPPTVFTGDKAGTLKAKVTHLFHHDQLIQQAKQAETIKIVLEASPFYGESGGQVGDTGRLKNKAVDIQISDTQKIGQTIIHTGEIKQGLIKVNDTVEATIDAQRRRDIAHNHTATHLLQAALRQVLGAHVRQAGSWVGPDKLRFDFSHFQGLNERQLSRVEELVNQAIKKDIKLKVLQMNFAQAQKIGALAFFGEKYQEKVRVIKIGDISIELCGGTHAASLGAINRFKITSESSLASGIRRIEAVTGKCAQLILAERKKQFADLSREFGIKEGELPKHLDGLEQRIKQLDKGLSNIRLKHFKTRIAEIIASAKESSGSKIIIQEIKSAEMEILRSMADLLIEKAPSAVIILAWVGAEKVLMVCAVTKDLTSRGLDAAKIIRALADKVEGSGGGRADFAQAGGKNPQGLNEAFKKAEEIINKELRQCR